MRKEKERKPSNFLKKGIIVVIFICLVGLVIHIAPNYIRNEIKDKTNLIINNNDVTTSLKYNVKVDENEIVYISSKDIANFFDGNIYYDNQNKQIITGSDTKIATIPLDSKKITVNGSEMTIYGKAYQADDTFYIPFSELTKVFNTEVKYIKETNVVTIDSLDREQIQANSKEKQVKYMPTAFSKTVDTIAVGDNVIVIKEEKGWTKIRTANGKIGYVKEVANTYKIRDTMLTEKQIEGTVSLVWDYYSEYAKAPTRSGKIEGVNVVSPSFAVLKKQGKGQLETNIGTNGQAYIQWAHENGYKVWPMISNNSMKETTSEILKDYYLRQTLIQNIVDLILQYDIDGINIDFENIYQADKDVFTRFIIELAPRLKEYGKVLSVDVTAPDGSEDWSLCYDRNEIAKVADYIVFMAYDQNGASSPTEGTTAGANWVEVNIKKFLGQEDVKPEKIILGMPFYTRLWKEANGNVTSQVVTMKKVNTTIPENVERVWDDELKQNYVEYTQNGSTYKMWIEDENSIKAKMALMNKYQLAGAAYWQKDFEPDTLWSIIAKEIKE